MTEKERLAVLRTRIDHALETLDELNDVMREIADELDAIDPQP